MTQNWAQELVGEQVLAHAEDGSVSIVSTAGWAEKTLGLYFSAHWCPPCRAFTPKLARTYNLAKSKNRDLELVFVSLDKTQQQFEEYFARMPWAAVKFEATQKRTQIADKFGVRGIPQLVVIDKDGIVNGDARNTVEADPQGLDFPWRAPPGSARQNDVGKMPFWQTVIWAILLWAAFKYLSTSG